MQLVAGMETRTLIRVVSTETAMEMQIMVPLMGTITGIINLGSGNGNNNGNNNGDMNIGNQACGCSFPTCGC